VRGRRGRIGVALASIGLLALVLGVAGAPAQPLFQTPAARPTDSLDPGGDSYTAPEASASPACTAHFCVHWVARGADAPSPRDDDENGIPDFVDRVEAVAEHVYAVENGLLGWRGPKCDRARGGSWCRTDVYLNDVDGALFGYEAPDPNQAGSGRPFPRRLYGYLVLDNDYSPREFPGTTQERDLAVTFAHEYCHVLQLGYDAYQDDWFAESSAVWMEDEVYDEVNDYIRYLRRWVRHTGVPITTRSIKEYGSVVWNKWLVGHYGTAIVRSAWARAAHTRPGGFAVAAYDSAIRAAGRSDFARDFARFAADLPEWRTDAVFPEGHMYPDVARRGRIPVGGRAIRRGLDHATFQLLRLRARGGRALVLKVKAPRGIALGAALVGRRGSERHGRVVTAFRFRRRGGTLRLRLRRPGRFARITAVLANADAAEAGFGARRLDWRYLADRAPFRASARLAR
jgi:hypothetical protein